MRAGRCRPSGAWALGVTLLAAVLACGDRDGSAVATPAGGGDEPAGHQPAGHQLARHEPGRREPAPGTLAIPADEPLWATLNGLLDHPGAYGEASWDDVRMRVVGHVATIGRDRARARAVAGDLAGCAEAYRDTARRLDGIPTASATGAPIRAALHGALLRDAALCDALARGEPPPVTTGGPGAGLAGLRARWHGLALRAASGGTVATEARALAAEARGVVAPALDPGAFADFEARHALRVKLVEAYVDGVDPLRPTDPWGYWSPDEVTRVATALAAAADALADGAHPGPEALAPARPPTPFDAVQLGALPTGDSLVDMVGFPGPRAIGTLEVLSLDDPAHRAWLDARAATLAALPDEAVPTAMAEVVATLDAHPHGSRYYNVKQARNAAVRVLASRGAFPEARAVLATSWPLHAQDWACPDRAAILRAIEGRLLLAAGDPGAGAALDAALVETERFLAHVASREGMGGPPPWGPPSAVKPPSADTIGPHAPRPPTRHDRPHDPP